MANKETVPHSNFLDMLFTHKSKTSLVFRDVLGLNNIDHIALTYVSEDKTLLSLSSTPALEFNLFSSDQWQFDNTYHEDWYRQCTEASWQSLYVPEHYENMYQLKQSKHHYSVGLSYSTQINNAYLLYSFASQKADLNTHHFFSHKNTPFEKIGLYCSNELLPLFLNE